MDKVSLDFELENPSWHNFNKIWIITMDNTIKRLIAVDPFGNQGTRYFGVFWFNCLTFHNDNDIFK